MFFKVKLPIGDIFNFFAAILLLLSCAPTVYSPHSQNEMISVHRPQEVKHDIGGGFALNKWLIDRGGDTVYVKTYPSSSVSLYHCAYTPFGKFNGFGGVEIICLPSQWEYPDISGFFLWFKPFLGWQYAGPYFTGRLNLSPLSVIAGYSDGEWGIAGGPTNNTIYQISLLLHNSQLSKHTWFAGVRMSSGAAGFVTGGDYRLTEKLNLRIEYSYLRKPPVSPFLSDKDLESIKGSIHYVTFGLFGRIK
ncbi:MAG: hypothetical protein WBB67_11180 [bacterium]